MLALERQTGRRLWRYQADAKLSWPVSSGPVAYVASERGTIHAVDLARGHELWRHQTGSEDAFEDPTWTGGSRLGVGHGALVFVRGGKLIAIDATTRSPRWTGPTLLDAVVGRSIAMVRLSESDAVFAAVDLLDGQIRWRVEIDDWVMSDPVIAEDEGLVIVRLHGGGLLAYEIGTGKLRWKFDLDEGERVVNLGQGRLLVTRRPL